MTNPRPPVHFEFELPADSAPLIKSNNEEFIHMSLPPDSIVTGSVGNQHIRLSGNDLELTLESVGAITVADLQWVEQHTVTRVFDSVSHFIRFVGGGELRFAFNLEGDLLELSGKAVAVSILNEGVTLVFQPSPSRQATCQYQCET